MAGKMKTTVCSNLDPVDAAWIAGFFDGEGYCVITGNGYPHVSISQCDEKVLDWIQRTTGIGKVYYFPNSASKLGNKPSWDWIVGATSEVESFLEEIEFYVKTDVRKEQVESVLAWCESKKGN